ncbi:MAG: S8 family serine peptidase [Kiritimatiellia bacterium]|nr:S8 family serine peptidase [Kiritimatiellia bacterium]
MKRFLYLGFGLLLCACAVCADSGFALRQDRIWFESEGLPLREFLRGFHEAGVRVRMDPEMGEEPISGKVVGEKLEAALDRIASAFDYSIIWSRIDSPAGPVDRVSELSLYRRGHPERASPFSPDSRLDVATADGHAFVRGELLLGFRAGTTQEQVNEILRRIGGEMIGGMPNLGIYRVRLPVGSNLSEMVALLKREESVAAAEPNWIYELPVGLSRASGSASPGRTAPIPGDTKALLAVLDSGIQSLDNLDAWVAGQFNTMDASSSAKDTIGHGTQMALIASGLYSPDGGMDSAIMARKILSIKGFNDDGKTSTWAVLEAVNLALENGARVLNISWGSETPSVFLQTAFAKAAQSGLILVASAGNEPTGRPVYPAAWAGVLAVGATDSDGTPSAYSNYGKFVDLSAPAQTVLPVGYKGPAGTYAGTSISGAFTAGILAQYLEMYPAASPEEAIRKMYESLTPHKDASYSSKNGTGILDAAAIRRFLGK